MNPVGGQQNFAVKFHCSKEQHHAKKLDLWKSLGPNAKCTTCYEPHPIKKLDDFAADKPLNPIYIRSLKLNTVHEGCVLRCVNVSMPALTPGPGTIDLLVEDELGDLTTVEIHNIPNSETWKNKSSEPKSLFPLSKKLQIAEPLFKVLFDGNCGIRVDNFKEVN
eukprot:Platyproteum_vivax@DN6701_c0_g1_i1.p1